MLDIPFERHVLDNGLRIVLSQDRATPVAAVNLWYGVGSRNEREGRTGFAHLFEHMMFQGSKHVPKNRHFELVERAGGSLNASTWFDRTNYFQTVPSHHLELALWLESDRMGWLPPAMTQEKLDNQRDVVKNERRQRYDNQPYGDWDERLLTLLYPPSHPYSHSVIGTMEDIDAATLQDVEEFFRTFYIPNNAVLTLCGDFEAAGALGLVEEYFGDIPAGPPIPELPGDVRLPPVLGETLRRRVEAEVPLPRIYVGARIPPYTSDAFAAAEVACSVLGTGRSCRLYRSLVRERRVAKDVACHVFPLVTGSAIFLLCVTGYPGGGVEALEEALAEELAAAGSAEEEEVARAVAMMEMAFLRGVEEVGERADLLSMCEFYFDDPGRLNREIGRLRSVTLPELGDFAGRHLGEDNRAVLAYLPGESS